MSRELKCADCGTNMGIIRDARLRTDLVVYCRRCNEKNQQALELPRHGDIPGFLRGFCGGGK